MTNILITGVAGFIGSHVAKRFVKEGFSVIGIDDLSSGKLDNVPSGVKFVQADLADARTFRNMETDPEFILHLGGQSSGEMSFDDPADDLYKNTISTLNLIKYGIKIKAKRIIYASSMSVYGATPDFPITESEKCSPLSCYGVSKLASEGYLKIYQSQLPFVILRMFNVYGPGQDLKNLRQGMVSIFMAQALKNGQIHVKGSGERFRDFIYIDDVVEAWYRATFENQAINKIINIGTGARVPLRELLDLICQLVPGCSYYESGSTPGDQLGIYANTSQLGQLLGLTSFVSIKDGVHKFYRHIELES